MRTYSWHIYYTLFCFLLHHRFIFLVIRFSFALFSTQLLWVYPQILARNRNLFSKSPNMSGNISILFIYFCDTASGSCPSPQFIFFFLLTLQQCGPELSLHHHQCKDFLRLFLLDPGFFRFHFYSGFNQLISWGTSSSNIQNWTLEWNFLGLCTSKNIYILTLRILDWKFFPIRLVKTLLS